VYKKFRYTKHKILLPSHKTAGDERGRGTVNEPTSPETEGEKGERGEEQDTANWLEGERHTPKKK
jgi:hypothetical protein